MRSTDGQSGPDGQQGRAEQHGPSEQQGTGGQPQLLARVHPEIARTEQDMTCHVFPLPEDGTSPTTLRAHCGFEIVPGQAQRLEGPDGMPCTACLMTSMLSN